MEAVRKGAALALALACAGIGAAEAMPAIDSVRLDGASAGRQVELRIQATDPAAPVTGLVAGFGRGEGGFGLSACVPDAAAGRQVTLTAPHVYATPGTRQVAARVTSAGCTGGQPAVLQRLAVPVAAGGATPQPVTVAAPEVVPLGTLVPEIPGLGTLPLGRADQPDPVALSVPRPLAGVAASCPGSTRRFRRIASDERRARRALLCLFNAERARNGVRALRSNRRLAWAAEGHSNAMVARRFFAHVGPGATGVADRLRRVRYIPRRGGRWLVGENIGFGRGRYTRPASMHRAWMRSSPHRAAILEQRFREVGFGVVSGRPYGRGGATFTADFGKRGR